MLHPTPKIIQCSYRIAERIHGHKRSDRGYLDISQHLAPSEISHIDVLITLGLYRKCPDA